jgi:hypothetical protein
MLFTKGGVSSGNGLVRLLQVERIPIKRDVLYIATGGVRLPNVTVIQFIWYYPYFSHLTEVPFRPILWSYG